VYLPINISVGKRKKAVLGPRSGSYLCPREGRLGDESLAGLETATREAMQKLMSNPHVQKVGETIRVGALKVSVFLLSFFLIYLFFLFFSLRDAIVPFMRSLLFDSFSIVHTHSPSP
jgi:hypothetical protein